MYNEHYRMRPLPSSEASAKATMALLVATIVMAMFILLAQVLPMFSIRESRSGDQRELLSLSLWGAVGWLFKRQQYFWALPLAFCSGIWPYCRLLLMSLTASPKAVLLIPTQRRRRLAILRDLGMLSVIAPCMILNFISVFRVEFPGSAGWIETATAVGGHLLCTAMILLEIFSTVLVLRVTEGFNIGSGRAVEDSYFSAQYGESQEQVSARQLRTVGMTCWILATDVALYFTFILPCFQVNYVVAGTVQSREFSILGLIQTAWSAGHSFHMLNQPVSLLAASGLVVMPTLAAAACTVLWILGERGWDAAYHFARNGCGGDGGSEIGSPSSGGSGGGRRGAAEVRRRAGFCLQELFGHAALGVFVLAVAVLRFRPGRVARTLEPLLQSVVVEPEPGFYLGCVVSFSLWMLVPRVAGIGSSEGGEHSHWDHEWAEAFTPRVVADPADWGLPPVVAGDHASGPAEARPLLVELPLSERRVMDVAPGTAAQPAAGGTRRDGPR